MIFNRSTLHAATETMQRAGTSVTAADILPVQRDRPVADVSTSLVSSHANWQPGGYWEGVFDIAVWLRLPQGSMHPLQLALRYTDQRGEKTVLVDICKPGGYKSALLNGSVRLEVSGRIKEMGLYLLGMPKGQPIGLDEWHFIPQLKRANG